MDTTKRALHNRPRISVLAASISALIATGGLGGTAFAQDDERRARSVDEEVVVTGTRIRRDDFSAPNATAVVTADDMRNLGVISVADMINQMPSNVANLTPTSNTDLTSFNLGASIANLRGLNPTYGTRTLTLVNSRRFTPSNNGGQVDLNMIPTALVDRIETVTGGASATYGADAMSGVVNVVLDNNMEGVRVDLSYNVTDEGDGDNIALSIGSGFRVLDGRGHVTIGYDRSEQDGIYDCETRELCRRGLALIQNGAASGTFFNPALPYAERSNIVFEGQPQWMVTEGNRFTILPEGIFWSGGRVDPALVADLESGTYTGNPADYNLAQGNGLFRLTPDGRDVLPYLEHLGTAEHDLVTALGSGAATPYGEGPGIYSGVPLQPDLTRDNLFTGFSYELDNGIELTARLTYGKTTTTSLQDSARQTMFPYAGAGACIFPDNAFLSDEWGASDLLQALFNERIINPNPDPVTRTGGSGSCRPAPYQGTSNTDPSIYDFPENGGLPLTGAARYRSNIQHAIDRTNIAETQTYNIELGANGPLFQDGSWTWDAYVALGKTERRQTIEDWQSNSRLAMALDSIWDPVLQKPVCKVNQSDPVARQAYIDKWMNFITVALADEAVADPALPGRYFAALSEGCAPFNPFGTQQSAESLAYAFPSTIDGTDNTQNAASVTFSGTAWRGVGAGPFRMAAGIDLRENGTTNFTGGDEFTARDFAINNYGDNWEGETRTGEMFVEFEAPLLRGKPGAEYLMINLADRRTRNTTERLGGAQEITTRKITRSYSSWKASMVWQPVSLMTLRATRSLDTRAPNARELFQTNTPSLQTGAINEVQTEFRADLYDPINDPDNSLNEAFDFYETISGGNSQLSNEESITETLGVVFTPQNVIPGLQVSIDYYRTVVKGGIATIGAGQVRQRCAFELGSLGLALEDTTWCQLVDFGEPDPAQQFIPADPDDIENSPLIENPGYPYSNILSVASGQENREPFYSKGIDFSVSYFKQLSGGGAINARLLASRNLEQIVEAGTFNVGGFPERNVAGQTGSNGLSRGFIGSLTVNYSPTPKFSGNMFMTYSKNAFSVTSQLRYIGRGRLNNQDIWIGPGEYGYYLDGEEVVGPIPYAWNLDDTVTYSELPSWATLNVNFNYDLARSRFAFDRFESLSVYLNVENIGDRIPNFFSGTGPGGVNTTFFGVMGRQYRTGVRMRF